ncbi:hypothetical protein [Streptomyces sp. NBC_01601]|uniref:hypothetical protein n=1 Tax=Streptomyces sp. NBC_01601 TaxID=2975892 RepID=UPI002E2A594F|nr:hypothetical protein [Streptomyces sp. NBC_01601]
MTQFSVYVEFLNTPDTLVTPPEAFVAIAEDLADYGGTTGTAPNGNLCIRLFLEGDSAVDAGNRGVEYAQGAAMKQGIHPAVAGLEVMTEAEFDRRLDEPLVPELAGTAEAADILGRSRTRVGQLLDAGDLKPHHVQSLASGPIFLAAGLRRYALTEHNSTRGVRLTPLPLTPAERALLEVLAASAANTPAPATTDEHQLAATAVESVTDTGQVRLHWPAAGSDLAGALDTLAGHKLIRSRGVFRKEVSDGHENDLVVTVLEKGHRHAAAAPAAQEEQDPEC